MFRRIRCSKVKLIAVLFIFSIVAGVQLLLSHSEGDVGRGSRLTALLSDKWRRTSEFIKPHGETWISGKI